MVRKKIDNNLSNIVRSRYDQIWCPSSDLHYTNVRDNSWFKIEESDEQHNISFNTEQQYYYDDNDTDIMKSKQVILILNSEQKKIINSWLNTYAKVYNETLKYIKKSYENTKKLMLNWMKVRQEIKQERDNIISKYSLSKNKKIQVHDADNAIKEACKNYKAAITNYKKCNIKYFRMRYWKQNKMKKIMGLESNNFKSGSIRKKILGDVKGYYNGKKIKFSDINKDCKLSYDKLLNRYTLYVPEKADINNNITNRNKVISLDPGIRTFMTGISEKKAIKIGDGVTEKLKRILRRKDNIMKNKEIPQKIKKKNERLCNKKIYNLTNDLHWQSLNYLTKNYENIFIGNMSTKEIISNDKNLEKITKRLGCALRLYEFRMRLKYKCSITNTKYKIVNESYTSKTCSICGNIKNDLGGLKLYSCENCGLKIDRDVNGARNIYLRNIKK